MPTEPAISHRASATNPYEGRWRWWYSAIADWMIRNPGRKLEDCATELGKARNTIYAITSTDLFRDYFAKRKAEWQRDHDSVIRSKLTEVTELALDAVKTKLEKQGDKVDLPLLTDLLSSSLDRLGFAPQTGPMVQVNQIGQQNNTVQLPNSVTARDLEEARMALRAAQSQYLLPDASSVPQKGAEPLLRESPELLLEAEPVEEEGHADPSTGS